MNSKYTESEDILNPLIITEEASRCLLCHDAPCSAACPAKTDPAKFIRSVRFRNFKGAAETIRENNPLGGICALVCPTEKYCEKACSRTCIDRPIEIAKIQRYVTEFESATKMNILKKPKEKLNKSIAIIGSGPAGLTLAAIMLQKGYDVDIYEKEEQLGGYLRYGIPEYRLPNRILDEEIRRILNLGLNVHNSVNVGIDITEEQIRINHDALVYAIGLSRGKMLAMFDNNNYVYSAVDYLKKIKRNRGNIKVPKKILIIGGGCVAMDIATSLKKIGTENVIIAAYEELKEFKATKKDLEIAINNNVSIYDGYIPTSVKGNIVKLEHRIIGSEIKIQADQIILAVGQEAIKETLSVNFENNTLGDKSYRINKNTYAIGDIAHNTDGTVVDAIRSAKEAANIIHEDLGGSKND